MVNINLIYELVNFELLNGLANKFRSSFYKTNNSNTKNNNLKKKHNKQKGNF